MRSMFGVVNPIPISVKDINRIASVVNAVLKKDGMLFGMHIATAFLPPCDLSNVNQRLVIRGRMA